MRVVQISDPHIFADPMKNMLGLNTAQSFAAVLTSVAENPCPPDIIVLTGDLSQDESEAAYVHIAKACERFTCPIYWIPGNHDAPECMQKVFAQTQLREDKAILLGDWLLILLNTHCPNEVTGLLGRSELSRLDYFLAQHPNQHALIMMHHHPVPIGVKWIDPLGLTNTDDFFAIVDKYPQIRSILFGHVHQVFETIRQGVPILSAPSTCIQFKPDTEKFTLDRLNPGYRWIDLAADGTFKTGIERVKQFNNTADFSSGGY